MTWKLAAVQTDVALADVGANLTRLRGWLREAADAGAWLVVFPECALSGYCYASKEEAMPAARAADGPELAAVAGDCADRGVFAVVGFLERAGEHLFNAAALIGPAGVLAVYRKIHLPFLGVDRFTTPGDRPFAVQDVGGTRVGMNICYDGSFPESSRVLSVLGADLILLPTNWPPGGKAAIPLVLARAVENHVYYAAVNRVGEERGFRFIGQSRILAPNGDLLAEAGESEETILYADIDPGKARAKKIVRVPGEHEIDRMADRRPDMYGPLSDDRKASGST
ncbi:MAG: carbon-nitrogen hydrolase family protein [Gemmataceae bacterium]